MNSARPDLAAEANNPHAIVEWKDIIALIDLER